ncbi:MAG: 30S ribosomal protein S8 [Candidatus Thermoplasmatota archaeon]|nr:30S ribosomal protein S8 [Candidatus Thermoplasmatota archaeon]MCL5730542.1 30S ribosomal protein S8 [Candidatus Thermoplasmatota archaeon]
MRHDLLNDVISQLKNASKVGYKTIEVKPAGRLVGRVLKVMQDYKYIDSFEVVTGYGSPYFRVYLNTTINNCGVIKPRFPVKMIDMEKFESRYLPAQDFGILILSTTKGVMSHIEARKSGVGGRLLAFVY